MIQIHNTITRQKEDLVPITPGELGMYVCGVTVYDFCHIGHARTFVSFDMIVRYLRYRGFKVKYVRNITDIDDKIIKRANEKGVSAKELSEEFITKMYEDFDRLNIARPDVEPRATDNIPEIIALVERLIKKGFAYVAGNGDVMFAIDAFKNYGRLSGQKLEELEAGSRVEVEKTKRNPFDFVLWKMAKEGEPFWESPWGNGRPGWHIECSAMNSKVLGQHFDIHGGGSDLIFPHHENEIAQSCCAFDTKYVNYWLHSGMVMINDEKMSKSLGNFFTIRDVLKQYDAETVRYFLISAQYRSPLNYSQDNLDNARASLARLYTALRDVKLKQYDAETVRYFLISAQYRSPLNYSQDNLDNARASLARLYTALRDVKTGPASGGEEYVERFTKFMDDDFNTPGALSVLFDLAKAVNISSGTEAEGLAGRLLELAGVLGLLTQDPVKFLQGQLIRNRGRRPRRTPA